MFLRDRVLGNDIKIKAFSGVSAGTSLCILNELSSIVAGVTQNPADFMGAAATGVQLDITSSSLADAAAGTGARTVTLYGLGPNWVPQVKTYSLSGQTAVTTPDYWLRVFAASVTTVGSGNYAAGDIYVYKTGTGSPSSGVPTAVTSGVLKIPVGKGCGYSGYWTVPGLAAGVAGATLLPGGQQGKKTKLQGLTLGVAAQNCLYALQAQPNLETAAPQDAMLATVFEIEMSGTAGGPGWVDLARHVEDFSPGTDIIQKILPGTAGAIVSAVLDLKQVGV